MRQSNQMKRILREQCRHRRTRIGRKWSPRRSSSSKPRVTPQPPSNRREVTQQGREGIQEKIDAELHIVGLEHFSEVIAQRMTLLEVLAARFNNDSRIIRRVRLEVLDRIASTLEPAP